MFELIDVWKAQKKQAAVDDWALAGASLRVPASRKIGLLGADASKNSSVLRMLAGLDNPDKGAIRRIGVPCWPFDYSGFSDNGASVRQNAIFLARVYGVSADDVVDIASTLSGVRVVRGKPMKTYAGPDRRALELGLTLAIQFDWYFIDERLPKPPEETGAVVHAAIADRIGRASMIWASTNPDVLRKSCDSGLVLDRGLLTFYDDLEEAIGAFEQSVTPQSKVLDDDDGQSGGKRRRRREARRARQNGAEKPV